MTPPETQERMPTGIPGLDHLLRGGLPRGNSLLIQGPPGSGKTTLAVRIIHEGIVRYDEPGLIITFEEFPKQIYEESRSFGLDLAALEAQGKLRIVWTTPARILEGFTGKNDLIDKIVQETKVRRLAIDSVTHFKRVAPSEVGLREALANILNYLKMRSISSVLLKELERTDEQEIPFEEYLADASIRLTSASSPFGGEDIRMAEVRKARGLRHISGRHPFVLSGEGPCIYPHLRTEDVVDAFPRRRPGPRERISTGIEALDRMLAGGLWRPSVNLISGYPGSGKTVLGCSFIDGGLRRSERCALVALNGVSAGLRERAAALGMDWARHETVGRLRLLEFPAVDGTLEQAMCRLLAEFSAFMPTRIVIDAVEDLRAVAHDEGRLHDFLHVLAAMTRAAGAATLLLSDCQIGGGSSNGRANGCNYLADTVITLAASERDGALRRRLLIAKHAGSPHSHEMTEFAIGKGGLEIGATGHDSAARPGNGPSGAGIHAPSIR